MRKIFASLKAVVAAALVASMTLAASCSYDDSAINNRVEKVEEAIKALEDRVKALEDHASAVDKLIDELVVVTDVTVDGDKTTVTLSDGTKITVYGECDTLQYRVNEGVLEVSADGQNWVAVEQTADCVITAVVVNDDNTVTFTLADGSEFTVALAELIECEAARTGVYVLPGATKEIVFTVNDAVVDMNIMNQPFGWSATVGEPTVEEENGGGAAPAPLAAGGTDYALKITGPSQALVNAGYAAKEGVVSVHFNTASGACKVLSVNVGLAEITMEIDATGNITITNSIVETVSNPIGVFTNFADFIIGAMPKSLYDEYGNEALKTDYIEMWGDANWTSRNSGLGNVIDLLPYEEGVYEREVIELTVDQLGNSMYPKFGFEYGGEYVIFIAFDYETVYGASIPVLENAILKPYKKAFVDASLVEGSETPTGATYNVSLAGYDNYLFGWMSVMEYQMFNMGLGAASFEEFLPQYMAAMGIFDHGTVITGTHIDEDINLADLASMSPIEWAPEILSETEYYFYIYPFNGDLSEAIYNGHTCIPENISYFGTFTTTAYAPGTFDAGVEYEELEKTEELISIRATFSDVVVTYASMWFDTPVSELLDPQNRIDEIIAEGELYPTAWGPCEAYMSDPTYPVYLGILAINAAGQYVYVEKEFLYVEPTLEQVAITSFEYVGRSYELDDNPETGGGDFVYDFTCADGTSYRMGLFYGYANADGSIKNGTYTYCTNNLNYMYTGWEGFAIVSDTYYYDSTLTVTAETITWKIPGQVEYVYTIGSEGGEDPEQPEVFEVSASAALVTDTTFNGFNPYDVTFGFENGDKVVVRFNTNGAQYLHLGNWQNDDWQNPHYISVVKYNGENAYISACNVAYENDTYTVTMSVFEYTNYNTLNYTYTGAIEGLIAPEACDCFKQKELPNTEDLTLSLLKYSPSSGYCDVVFCDSEQKNVIVVSLNDCPLVDCTYTVESSSATSTNPGTMYLNGCFVAYDGYQTATSAYLKSGSVDVEVNGDGTYTITFDLVLTNDQVYSGVYTGAIA
ncbi:MAG: hypothetical protein J6V59_02995 [Alistipes sp.]|nr:hypothetical protein [Alistipes sp.]